MKPTVSILYVYYNTPKEILHSLTSLSGAAYGIPYEVVIVNNASPKPLPRQVSMKRGVHIITNRENIGFGKGHNKAVSRAKGKYLLILNPDTILKKKALRLMVEKLESNKKIGIIGPQMIDKDGKILPTISKFPTLPTALIVYSVIDKLWKHNPISQKFWMYDANRTKEQEVDVLSGACMMIRKSLFKSIHGFDNRFFLYFEESDLCMKVKNAGYRNIYFPKARITHLIGKSSSNKEFIRKAFQTSRLKFFRKYHDFIPAFIAEGLLRFLQPEALLLFGLLLLSLGMNLYKIADLMMFIGDFGRDYLAARDMILTGTIPLLGIPSSVVWLHQGPLSVYLIGLAFLIGHFHPVAPAVLYGSLGVVSTYLVYRLGKMFFSKHVGLIAGLLYATSPLVIVNTRMPYHTSPIPLVTTLLFLFLYKVFKTHERYLPFAAFFLGLSLQFELSNAVLVFLIGILWIIFKPKITKRTYIYSFITFLVGIAPFLIYDLTHGFVQTAKFALWIVNRVRLFFGLTLSNNSTTAHLPEALQTIWEQVARVIFPSSGIIFIGMLVLIAFVLFIKRKQLLKMPGLIIILLWLVIPLIGFAVHAAPGTAYFPLLFAPICILLAYSFTYFVEKSKVFLLLLGVLVIGNIITIQSQEYFLTTRNAIHSIPFGNYGIGTTWKIQDELVRRIVSDANKNTFQLKGGGFFSKFPSSIDDYKYLVWWRGGKEHMNAKLIYTIYPSGDIIANNQKIVYKDAFITLTKQEK